MRADSFQALPYRNKQPFSIYDKSYGEALALVGPLIAAKNAVFWRAYLHGT